RAGANAGQQVDHLLHVAVLEQVGGGGLLVGVLDGERVVVFDDERRGAGINHDVVVSINERHINGLVRLDVLVILGIDRDARIVFIGPDGNRVARAVPRQRAVVRPLGGRAAYRKLNRQIVARVAADAVDDETTDLAVLFLGSPDTLDVDRVIIVVNEDRVFILHLVHLVRRLLDDLQVDLLGQFDIGVVDG